MRPRWSLLVLVFPCVSVGASGSNEIGGKYQFPGTYTVRPSTLRAVPLIIDHDNARMTTDVTPRPTVAGLN